MKNIHILPTDKPSRLQLNKHNKIFLSEELKLYSDCINQNIYITSDEEIKEGWSGYAFKEDVEGKVFKHFYTQNEWYKDAKKIILTDNQDLIKDGVQAIDDDFLEWFVKNPSCEKVDVWINKFYGNKKEMLFNVYGKYKIIIPKEGLSPFDLQESPMTDNEFYQSLEEPKQETLEEVARTKFPYKLFVNVDVTNKQREAFIEGYKLAQERSYSEQEVKAFVLQAVCFIGSNWDSSNLMIKFNEFFKQFKKK